MYIKPTSPTKSPTNTLGYNNIGMKSSIPRHVNGDSAKLLTTSVSYLKGAAPKPPGKMAWNKDVTADKLSFTMKREFDKQKEELDLLQQLRTVSIFILKRGKFIRRRLAGRQTLGGTADICYR